LSGDIFVEWKGPGPTVVDLYFSTFETDIFVANLSWDGPLPYPLRLPISDVERPPDATHLTAVPRVAPEKWASVPLVDKPRPDSTVMLFDGCSLDCSFMDTNEEPGWLTRNMSLIGADWIHYDGYVVYWAVCRDRGFGEMCSAAAEAGRCSTTENNTYACTVHIDAAWPTEVTHFFVVSLLNGNTALVGKSMFIEDRAVAKGVEFLDTAFDYKRIGGLIIMRPADDERSVKAYHVFFGNGTHAFIYATSFLRGAKTPYNNMPEQDKPACCGYLHVLTEGPSGMGNCEIDISNMDPLPGGSCGAAMVANRYMDDASGYEGGNENTCFDLTEWPHAAPEDPLSEKRLPLSYIEAVRYECDEGYTINNIQRQFQLLCMRSQELECPPGLNCVCRKEVCPPGGLTYPDNALRVKAGPDMGEYGDRIDFRCQRGLETRTPGFEASPILRLKCQSDRVFDCDYTCGCAPIPKALVFYDTDTDGGYLGGVLTIERAQSEEGFNINAYEVFWAYEDGPVLVKGMNPTSPAGWKRAVRLEVPAAVNGTDPSPYVVGKMPRSARPSGATHLYAFAAPIGASSAPYRVPIIDASAAVNVTFEDFDPLVGMLTGTVTIARAMDETDIIKYHLYWGTDASTKFSRFPFRSYERDERGPVDEEWPERYLIHPFDKEDPPNGVTHILVRTQLYNLQEMETGASIPICDCCNDDITHTQSFGCEVGGRMHSAFSLLGELHTKESVAVLLRSEEIEAVVRSACIAVRLPEMSLRVEAMDRGNGKDGKVIIRLRGPRETLGALRAAQEKPLLRQAIEDRLLDRFRVIARVWYGPCVLEPGMPISYGIADIVVPGTKAPTAPVEKPKDYSFNRMLFGLGAAIVFVSLLIGLGIFVRAWRARRKSDDYFDREWAAYKGRANDADHDARDQDVEHAPGPAEPKRYRETKPAWGARRLSDFAKPSMDFNKPSVAPERSLPHERTSRPQAREVRPAVSPPKAAPTPAKPTPMSAPPEEADPHLARVRAITEACGPVTVCLDGAALLVFALDAVPEDRLAICGNRVATAVEQRPGAKLVDICAVREAILGGLLDSEGPSVRFAVERLLQTEGPNNVLLRSALKNPDFRTAFEDAQKALNR
jgi:hypothetical protein